MIENGQMTRADANREHVFTESDVTLAYRLVLGRDPDAEGLKNYLAHARAGLSFADLLVSLLGSAEFKQRLAPESGLGTDPTPVAPPDSHTDGLISPADVIRRYSLEQLSETADEYYRRIPDPTPLMAKPLAFLHEAPAILENLGHLLTGLQLGKTMTVLDFGGGTGWLSRMLAQLNCQPICCDVSTAALEIARRLIDGYPLIGTAPYKPRLLPFDGHHIDLPDESVDRIICFDAFHHVPNPDEVIREFGRVLKTGGVAGFSEPGRHHSRSPQSQYEMQNHRVLENDIDLDQIFASAREAGFTSLTIRALNDMELSLDQYRAILGGSDQRALEHEVWRRTRDALLSRTIFFLHKGPLRRDSRSHIGLAHSIRVDHSETHVGPGSDAHVSLTISNVGDAHWLNTNSEIFGIVRLGAHLYDDTGRLLNVDHFRADLPRPVAPGEQVQMSVTVPLPSAGSCRLGFDLVAEGVTWFENQGSAPVSVAVTRD